MKWPTHALACSMLALSNLGIATTAFANDCAEFTAPRTSFGDLTDAKHWSLYDPPQPDEIASYQHGTLTGCRTLTAATVQEATSLSFADEAYALRFVTEDSEHNKVLGSAVLFTTNADDWNNDGDFPVVVFNTATIGIDAHCGATVQTLSNESTALVSSKVNRFLRDGYNVLVPDYFGHGIRGQNPHPYLEGKSNAHAVLDAILAARSMANGLLFQHAAPTMPVPLAMQGYSQGGHVTAWATESAPSYAPEIQFNAIRAGGVPVNLAVSLGDALDAYEAGGDDSGFAAMIYNSLLYATDMETRFTDSELADFIDDEDHVDHWVGVARDECRTTAQFRELFGGLEAGTFDTVALRQTTKFKKWFIRNSLSGGLARELLGVNSAEYIAEAPYETTLSRPSVPFMIYGSAGDTIAPMAESYGVLQSWSGPVIPESDTVLGYINVPNADQVWMHTTGLHGLDEADLYWTAFARYRYTPDQWLKDRMQ